MNLPFDWTKADQYARNYILLRLEDAARGLESAAVDPGVSGRARRLAEQRAYAARAAISSLSRQVAQ